MYATRDDLNQAYSADLVDRLAIRLGDEDGSEAVTRALAHADSVIDACLSTRFTLPLPSVPAILVGIAADLTVARLAGADAANLTDDIKHREKTARTDLDKIADGRMNLGLPTADQGDRPSPIVASSGGKLMTRDRLRGL